MGTETCDSDIYICYRVLFSQGRMADELCHCALTRFHVNISAFLFRIPQCIPSKDSWKTRGQNESFPTQQQTCYHINKIFI